MAPSVSFRAPSRCRGPGLIIRSVNNVGADWTQELADYSAAAARLLPVGSVVQPGTSRSGKALGHTAMVRSLRHTQGVSTEVGSRLRRRPHGRLDGNVLPSAHLIADASARTKRSFVATSASASAPTTRTTRDRNVFVGLPLIDSPLEFVSVQHMRVVHGSNNRIDGGYCTRNNTRRTPPPVLLSSTKAPYDSTSD